ncbi:MAG: hypothetical protein H6673_01060 [Anaerolineales bacterium]|nr:hypothetical protein [Anaerolineales bacterium]
MRPPVLSAKALKDTYKAIRDGDFRKSIFHDFVLVAQQLKDPSALRGDTAEDHAISTLLIELTTQEYNQLRLKHQFLPVDDQCTRDDAIEDMAIIRDHDSNLVVGASAVYYYFVRYDLDWPSLETVYEYLDRPDRTARRHANQFIAHMVSVVMEREQEARSQDRETRCWLALPHQDILAIESQRQILSNLSNEFPQAVLIRGQTQSGRTTNALNVGRYLIQDPRIAEVVWINLADQPSRPLADVVCNTLRLPVQQGYQPEQVLDGYLQLLLQKGQYLLIVLDNCDDWRTSVEVAWRWLSHCVIVATLQRSWSEWRGIQIEVPSLNQAEAQHLMEFWNRDYHKSWTPYFDELWTATGGNLGVLRHALALLGQLPIPNIFSLSALSDYYRDTWHQLSEDEQTLWVLLDIWGIATYPQINEIGFLVVDLDHILLNLLDLGFISVQSSMTYQVSPSIRPSIVTEAEQLILRLLPQIRQTESLILPFWASDDYHSYVAAYLKEMIEPAHEQVATTGEWQWWLEVCQNLAGSDILPASDQLLFRLESAVALRWLGRFNEGLHELGIIMEQNIDETLRSQVLIEKSTLYFYNNQLPEALETAQAAHACMESNRSRLALLRVLSRTDPQRAKAWFPQLNQYDPAISSMRAEIEIKMNNYPQAIMAARQALELLPAHSLAYARSQCLLAQALALQGEFDESETTFAAAVNRLHHQHDIVGLARFYTNYGVAMIYAGRWEEARQLSQWALGLYEKLQDAHGQQAAEENLRLIDKASRLR